MSPGAALDVRGRRLSRCIVSCGPSSLVPAWKKGPRLECRNAALAFWLQKLDISVRGSESGAPASSPDEEMLDWLVVFARSGWNPRVVLTCFFPVFGDLLFQMISDHAEEI